MGSVSERAKAGKREGEREGDYMDATIAKLKELGIRRAGQVTHLKGIVGENHLEIDSIINKAIEGEIATDYWDGHDAVLSGIRDGTFVLTNSLLVRNRIPRDDHE